MWNRSKANEEKQNSVYRLIQMMMGPEYVRALDFDHSAKYVTTPLVSADRLDW